MHIGIPKETKTLEGRVGLIPAAAAEMVRRGHTVLVEAGAGLASGYSDADYRAVGVDVVADAGAVYGGAQLIVKVKEPIAGDLALLRAHHILFSYLHLAPLPELTRQLQEIGLTAIGFETVALSDGRLPLLEPMSDIAGRLAVQIGGHLLHQPMGGRGILLGGLPAAERGRVVVLGAGTVGGNAALLAAAMGAEVVVFDRQRVKLERMRALGGNVTALYPYADTLTRELARADLFVGAVLVAGARAPHVISAEMVRSMQNGAVIVDVAVDQGGCVETTRPTDYVNPTYTWEGVTHFAVTNMPGAVPRSASQALSAAVLPYLERLAQPDWEQDAALRAGVNVRAGEVVHPALRATGDAA